MTKSEARAINIDKLDLSNKKPMLDVGVGTGSISIQAAREFKQLTVTVVEMNPDGIDIIQQNINKFGLNNIKLVQGTVPADIPDQKYDAIFVGGSGTHLNEAIRFASTHLSEGGAIGLNFTLSENAMQVEKLLRDNGFKEIELIEVGVLRWYKLGKGHLFKPNNPTIVVSTQK